MIGKVILVCAVAIPAIPAVAAWYDDVDETLPVFGSVGYGWVWLELVPPAWAEAGHEVEQVRAVARVYVVEKAPRYQHENPVSERTYEDDRTAEVDDDYRDHRRVTYYYGAYPYYYTYRSRHSHQRPRVHRRHDSVKHGREHGVLRGLFGGKHHGHRDGRSRSVRSHHGSKHHAFVRLRDGTTRHRVFSRHGITNLKHRAYYRSGKHHGVFGHRSSGSKYHFNRGSHGGSHRFSHRSHRGRLHAGHRWQGRHFGRSHGGGGHLQGGFRSRR